jgi:predicted transcriptional regulator
MAELGRFEEVVLKAILAVGGEAPMGDIFQMLTSKGKNTTFGALYTTLTRMGRKKLVTRWKDDPRPIPGGRSRYMYRITNAGRIAVIHVDQATAAFGYPTKLRPATVR